MIILKLKHIKLRCFNFIIYTLAIIALVACNGCVGQQEAAEVETNIQSTFDTSSTNTASTSIKKKLTITSAICNDEQGPDCRKLRLGDDYHTNSTPQRGYLYSCDEKNPNAPGSVASKITWINFVENVWNFFEKPWLPEGSFRSDTGNYTETLSTEDRKININNLPVDGKIGDWPMTNYSKLTEIDSNPGIPSSHSYSFTYPIQPSNTPSPACVSLGAIGVTKNGVVIYSAVDGRGNDALAHEIVDVFGGHPAMSDYHYHFIPERLDNKHMSNGHSEIVGYINDGFPIYGYIGIAGVEMSNDDLDECHGHAHGLLGYHYHATIEYPYTIGCYMGIPVLSSSNENTNISRPPPAR